MRKLRCFSLVLLSALFSLLFSCTLVSDTSAYNYFDSVSYPLSGGSESLLYTSNGSFPLSSVGGGALRGVYPSQVTPSYSQITSLHLCTTYRILPNSLVYFNVTYVDQTGSGTVYTPLALQSTGSYINMVSTSYGEYGRASYVFYLQQNDDNIRCFDFRVDGNNSMWGAYSRIDISAFSGVQLQQGATQEQIYSIASQLDTIIDSLDNMSSSAEAEMNEKDNQDRSDIESQSSSIDSSGESSQQSAQNTGTTLLAAFSSFVTAITSANPSNCNIDMDLGNLDLGVVNFCTLSPPPEFQALGSIFLILFCVPLSIATARKVISLFRSFQG